MINKHLFLDDPKNYYDNVSQRMPEPAPALEMDFIEDTQLERGSMIQVSLNKSKKLYGVIRWIGIPPGGGTDIFVGVELEDFFFGNRQFKSTDDGRFLGIRLFNCAPGRGLFVPPGKCSADRRFDDDDDEDGASDGAAGGHGDSSGSDVNAGDAAKKMFGNQDCPIVTGRFGPISKKRRGFFVATIMFVFFAEIENNHDLEKICGKFKGIQGHHNSCYLDATLFSMFSFTSVFDSVLYRARTDADTEHYDTVREVLRDEIVNPLRLNKFVRADRVMKLRELLQTICSVKGLTSEEKDPEEFLNVLFSETLKAEPFLKV